METNTQYRSWRVHEDDRFFRHLPSLWRSNWEFLKSFCRSIVFWAGTITSCISTAVMPEAIERFDQPLEQQQR